MPWWMVAYLLLFISLLIGNMVFWFKNRGKAWVIIYELCSGIYLIYAIIAYWYPAVLKLTTVWPLWAIPALLLFECYYSIWGDTETLVPEGKQRLEGLELEIAKAASIVLATPAYLTAAKLFIDSFFGPGKAFAF